MHSGKRAWDEFGHARVYTRRTQEKDQKDNTQIKVKWEENPENLFGARWPSPQRI